MVLRGNHSVPKSAVIVKIVFIADIGKFVFAADADIAKIELTV